MSRNQETIRSTIVVDNGQGVLTSTSNGAKYKKERRLWLCRVVVDKEALLSPSSWAKEFFYAVARFDITEEQHVPPRLNHLRQQLAF